MRFRPSMAATLAMAVVTGACAWLGWWQLDRAADKQALLARFDNAPEVTGLDPAQPAAPYTRAALDGHYDLRRHILVDNRIQRGRPGVHVLTPFNTADGAVTVLVNRGWLPMRPDRTALPEVPETAGLVRISGHLDGIAAPGVRLGEAAVLKPDRWPQLVTYPEPGLIADALQAELYPLVLYLDQDSPGGFEGRQWTPFTIGPEKHRGYAVQWFALALAALIAWTVLGRARGNRAVA